MASKASLSYASLALVSAGVYALYKRRTQRNLPPGPPKYPLIGNLLSLPAKLNSDFFLEMGKQYSSDLLHFEGFGMDVLVINSYEAAQELLEKRSGIYSSRPHSTFFNELSGWGFQFALWPYGDGWRSGRKLFTQHFSSTQIHQPREITYIHRLLHQLLQDPEHFFSYVKHLSASITLDMTYGIKITSRNDPYLELVEKGSEVACDLLADGAHLVDLFPLMKYIPTWFPGADFQKKLAHSREYAVQVLEKPFAASKEKMKSGRYERSFVTSCFEEMQDSKYTSQDEQLLKLVAGQVFLAGSDTAASSLGTFFLAMVTHPEVQKKAQEELDTLLQGRLPEHQDLPMLPYLNALILEVYRWRAVAPVGIPHANILEDVYSGYFIPAGSTVIINQQAMLHDEAAYPDPLAFKPERFLKDEKLDSSIRNPMDIAFGFGRRMCPGRHIAHSIIVLATASVLSTFNILKQQDENGNVIEPKGGYGDGIIRLPNEFPCAIKPRSAHAIELVQSVAEELDS